MKPPSGTAAPAVAHHGPKNRSARDEGWRRALHVASGAIGPLATAVGSRVATPAFAALVVLACTAEAARFRWPWARAKLDRFAGGLFRPNEGSTVSGAATLALGYALAWWLFPVTVAERAILVAALADPMAAMVGSRFGGGRRKSWAGAAACAGTAALLLLFTGLPGATCAGAAVVAAAVELVPWRGADNISIPVGVGAVLWWMA